MKKYKVLLSSKVYSEKEVYADNLEKAKIVAKEEFDGLEEDAWACDVLPQDKHYWRIEEVSPEEL